MTFAFNKNVGELTITEVFHVRSTFKRIVEDILGFDNFYVEIHLQDRSLLISVRAADKFNARNLWSDPDVPAIMLKTSIVLPLDESADEALNRELSLIGKFPTRVSRERQHMAWVLNGQFERLGHYSDEARTAFQDAFRRSMEDAGLTALMAPAE